MPVDPIAAQAAEWIVALSGDDPARREQARAGYADWLAQDPRHAIAARRMEALLGRLTQRPARAALARAVKSGTRRRAVTVAVALAALVVAIAVPTLLAETPTLRAATGEWHTYTLADGSQVTLNSNSAVDVHFDGTHRDVTLRQGEMLVTVAKDAARPFVVHTDQGTVQALGTRFVVSRGVQSTDVAMLESRTEVRGAAGGHALTLAAGESARLLPAGPMRLGAIDPGGIADAWRLRQLVVRDRPMQHVLDELGRHRPGLLRYDARQIAALRVTAVLPLDDTDRALQLLMNTFPSLRVRTVTPYLVMVDAPGS